MPLSSKVSHIDVRNLRSRDCISKDLADIRRKKEIEKKENKLSTHKYELLSRAYCYKEQTLPKNHDKYNKIDSKIYNEKENKYENSDRNYISSSISYKSKDTRVKTNYIHDLQNIIDRNERSGTPGCVLDCMQTLGVLVWDHPGVRPNRYGIKIFDVNLILIFLFLLISSNFFLFLYLFLYAFLYLFLYVFCIYFCIYFYIDINAYYCSDFNLFLYLISNLYSSSPPPPSLSFSLSLSHFPSATSAFFFINLSGIDRRQLLFSIIRGCCFVFISLVIIIISFYFYSVYFIFI